ncbi:aminopeptidase P isoform X2 [Brevipalpus obovatus]|uniref:aminopeptidase P isoform X2 n=1 Tax=Brevipalpus obovatus TaxID=246614 RepID=UPI003D9DEF70
MECQYVATQRGGIALVFEGHRYNKVRDGKDGTVYWRCSRDRQCPGRAVTVNNRVKKANNKHNHPAENGSRNGSTSSTTSITSNNNINNNNISNNTNNINNIPSPAAGFTSLSGPPSSSLPPTNSISDCHTPRIPSSIAMQDVLSVHTAAAAAAVSFPAIVSETLKYLAYASGNHQMASFASTMANQFTCQQLENLERSICRTNHLLPVDDSLEPSYYSDSSNDQPLNMSVKNSGQLLKRLRSLMKGTSSPATDTSLNAYYIVKSDAHQSEYLADCDERLAFFTGFTGSAGKALVTMDDALLWVDGRYYTQAESQVFPNWTVMKQGLQDVLDPVDWMNKSLISGSRIGTDPMLISHGLFEEMKKKLSSLGNHHLIATSNNLIDLIWEDRPSMPSNPIIPYPTSMAGTSWPEKVEKVRIEMAKKNTSALVLTALDEIAWLFNLRGSDIDFNPVFFAYTVITMDNIYLFVDESKLTNGSRKHLHLDLSPAHHQQSSTLMKVELREYKLIQDFLKWLVSQESEKIWIPSSSSEALVSIIPESRRYDGPNPVLLNKAIKNKTEIECMKQAHIKDAVALCEFFAWLEVEITKGDVDEIKAANKLDEFRRTQEEYIGPSFETISAAGPNGAIIHYKPSPETCRKITTSEIFLLDSGAQFRDGTTDVTRTVHFGTPSDFEKEAYTMVTKGHIGLALSKFPSGTKGCRLDSFARQHLWELGLDYEHGTGHGVGVYLNVHEGPISISSVARKDDPGLSEGMILSNEPGYYEDGKFGIRIESLILVKKVETKYNFRNKGYLGFETITLVPIQTKLLEPSLLTPEEIEWLDTYHQSCRDVVGKVLQEQGRSAAYQWLMKETQPIG